MQTLIDTVHVWVKETDGNGGKIRRIPFGYKKAFDLINYRILKSKLELFK